MRSRTCFMTPMKSRTRPFDPHAALAQVLAELGTRRTLAALLRQLAAAKRPPPRPRRRQQHALLDNHLRRDIGLPPLPSGRAPPHGFWLR